MLVVGGWWLVVGGWWLVTDWVGLKIVLVLVLVLVLDPRPVASLVGGFGFGLIAEGRQLVAGGRGALASLNRYPRWPLSIVTLARNLRAFRELRGEPDAQDRLPIPNPGYDPHH